MQLSRPLKGRTICSSFNLWKTILFKEPRAEKPNQMKKVYSKLGKSKARVENLKRKSLRVYEKDIRKVSKSHLYDLFNWDAETSEDEEEDRHLFDYPPTDPLVKRVLKDRTVFKKAKAKRQEKEVKKRKKEEQKRLNKEERRKAREDRRREREEKRLAREQPHEVIHHVPSNPDDGQWQTVPAPKWKQRMEKSMEKRSEPQPTLSAPITRSRAKLVAQSQSQK